MMKKRLLSLWLICCIALCASGCGREEIEAAPTESPHSETEAREADGVPFSYCTGERVKLFEELQQMIDSVHRYIPVDANLVSGYSGGPAFNLSGELIGISNAAYIEDLSAYGYNYLGFIIPINEVRDLIEENCK